MMFEDLAHMFGGAEPCRILMQGMQMDWTGSNGEAAG